MNRCGFSVIGLLCALLLPAAVGAKERFERVTIVEEGSSVAVQVTDAALLDFFSFSEFPAQILAHPPKPTTKAYVVMRGTVTPDGVYEAFDQLHYYPGESPTQPGFVYYDGLVKGWSEYDKKWYVASAEGDRAMAKFIATHSPSANTDSHIQQSGSQPLVAADGVSHRSNRRATGDSSILPPQAARVGLSADFFVGRDGRS
jgi:hypothetical protein